MFPRLFSTLKLGHVTVNNRICTSAHAECLAEDGLPTEKTIRYYEAKAKGGVGLILCFGSASVHPTSTARDWNGVELFEDRVVPHLRNFSEAVHCYDVPVIAQITHRGRRGRSTGDFGRLYGPSPIREPKHRETPHELDEAMMTELVEAFADAAWRLKEGGFDGCEVMASHCHLIDQFWTPNANQRRDDYGGELGNRLRFGFRVIESIRQRVGKDFVVGVRITGNDFTRGGLDEAAMKEIVQKLADTKLLDFYNVIGSTAETSAGEARAIPDMSFEHGLFAHLAAAMKEIVDVPVITAGRIVTPEQAERVLEQGQADLVIMNRSLIADPELPNKAREGATEEIRICRGYNEGCIDRIYTGLGVTCVQNPLAGRETELSEVEPSENPRKVVIAGGGCAGMEAARVAALRGHRVVLIEKSNRLGGQTLIAARAPSRGEFDGAARWLARQLERLGVAVHLDTEATVERLLAEKPDAVLVATGARPLKPKLPGLDEHPSWSCWDVLSGRLLDGERIAVIDEEYGFQGPTTAELLLDAGKKVELVTSAESIATELGATTRPPLYQRLFEKGIVIRPHIVALAVEKAHLVGENAWSGTPERLGPYDGFVYAFGGEAVDGLYREIRTTVPLCHSIGDCFAPRTLQHAIYEGHITARRL